MSLKFLILFLITFTASLTSCLKFPWSKSSLNAESTTSNDRMQMDEYKGFGIPNKYMTQDLPVGLTGLDLDVPATAHRENWVLSNPRSTYTVTNIRTTLAARVKWSTLPEGKSVFTNVVSASVSGTAFVNGSFEAEWPVEVKETLNVYIFAAKKELKPYLFVVDENGKAQWGIKPEDQINVVAMCDKAVSFRSTHDSPQITTYIGGGLSGGVTVKTNPFQESSGEATVEVGRRKVDSEFLDVQTSKNSHVFRPDLTKSYLYVWKECIDHYESPEWQDYFKNQMDVVKSMSQMEIVIESECVDDNQCSELKPKADQVGIPRCEPADPKVEKRFENTLPKVCRIRAQEGDECTLYNPSNPYQRVTSHEKTGECGRGLACQLVKQPQFGWLGWLQKEKDMYEVVTKPGKAICVKR